MSSGAEQWRYTPVMSVLDLGASLRAERLRQGLSLRETARRLGISASALSQIETGKAQPSVSKLFDIVNLLGVSVDDLLAESREPRPTFRALYDAHFGYVWRAVANRGVPPAAARAEPAALVATVQPAIQRMIAPELGGTPLKIVSVAGPVRGWPCHAHRAVGGACRDRW